MKWNRPNSPKREREMEKMKGSYHEELTFVKVISQVREL